MFSNIINVMFNIGNSVLNLVSPVLDFLSDTVSINGVIFSYFDIIIGSGLILVITWGIIKWVAGL